MGRLFRRVRRDDEGVTEIVGFIMTFAISAIILIISTQAFLKAREDTDHIVTGVELKNVANRVATRVVQAGIVAQEFPNATYSVQIRVPQSMGGKLYDVTASNTEISGALLDDSLSADATTYKLDQVKFISVTGTVDGSVGTLKVEYKQTRYASTSSWSMPDGEFGSPATKYVTKQITLKKNG